MRPSGPTSPTVTDGLPDSGMRLYPQYSRLPVAGSAFGCAVKFSVQKSAALQLPPKSHGPTGERFSSRRSS